MNLTYNEIDNLINEHSDELFTNAYHFQQPITLIEDDDTIILRNTVRVYRFLHQDESPKGEEACIFTLANGKCVLIENRKIIKFPKDSTSSIDVYEADDIMWIDIGSYSYKNNNKWSLVIDDEIITKDVCDLVCMGDSTRYFNGKQVRYLKNGNIIDMCIVRGKGQIDLKTIANEIIPKTLCNSSPPPLAPAADPRSSSPLSTYYGFIGFFAGLNFSALLFLLFK